MPRNPLPGTLSLRVPALLVIALTAPLAHAAFGPPATFGWSYDAGAAVTDLTSAGGRAYASSPNGNLMVLRGTDGRLLWSAALGAPAAGQVAVREGRVYVGTTTGHVVCLRPPMLREGIVGMEEWRFSGEAPVACGPIATAGGHVVFADEAGDVHALTLKGQRAWSVSSRSRIVASPAASTRAYPVPGRSARSPLVYWGAVDGNLQAVAEGSGQPVWGFNVGGSILVSPVLIGDVLVAGTETGAVYGLDAGSGQVLWQTPLGDALTGGLGVSGSEVCAASGSGVIALLKVSDGSVVWRNQVLAPVSAAPVATATGHVLVAAESGMAYALRRTDGRVMWARNLKTRLCTGLVLADERAVYGTAEGQVCSLVRGGPWQIDAAPNPVAPSTDAADAAALAPELTGGEERVVLLPAGGTPTLVTRPADPSQPAVQVTDEARIVVMGSVPEGATAVEVNDVPAAVTDGAYRASLELGGAGSYPVTVRARSASGLLVVERRLVVVGEGGAPGSPAPIFVAPGDASGASCATFTVLPGNGQGGIALTSVELRDDTGRTIRKWADSTGQTRSFAWDGRDANGQLVAQGAYRVVCRVTDHSGRARVMHQPLVVAAAG